MESSPPHQTPDPSHLLPEHTKTRSGGAGPIVGTIIILALLLFGGLYFWGAALNREQEPLPFIPDEHAGL